MSPTPRGYERLAPVSPAMKDPLYFAWVDALAQTLKAAEPWTLVRLPGEVHYCIAVRRNWWMRLVTRWHNVWRRWTRRAYERSFARRANATVRRS